MGTTTRGRTAITALLVGALAGAPGGVVAQERVGRGPLEGSPASISWPDDASTPAAARPLRIPRLEGPVEVDGRPDEAAWERVPPLPVTMLWPSFRGEMTEETEIRIAYDDEALYASGRFLDGDPDGVRANSFYRDRWAGDDAFDLIVDAFNDDRTALKFTTTPLGILLDEEIRNDAEPGPGIEYLNPEWNAFWSAESRVTEEGWLTEMRIPFSTLRFQPDDRGQVIMGIIAARYISRKSEKHIFPAIPPRWEAPDFKPSQARDVILEDVSSDRLVEVAPYALAGLRGLVNAPPAAEPEGAGPREVGLDLKYGLTSNLTLDLTANTDFAQVESDALQVNLSRFNLFFPEKRGFFQERASVFEFNASDEVRLFHSRRIGLGPDGEPVRILGGARLAGRAGLWDVGVLDLQLDGGDGRPGENTGVARARRGLGDGVSYVGGMLTSRIPTEGGARLDYGADGLFALGDRELLTVQLARSWREEGEGASSISDASLARLFLERRSANGWGYHVDLARAGPGFDPALGFLERADYTAFKGSGRYTWQMGEGSGLRWHRAIVTSRLYLRNRDGAAESALQRFRWQAAFDGGTFFNAALNFEHERLAEPLDLAGQATVPAGTYRTANLFLYFSLNAARRLGGSAIVHGGSFLDGWLANVRLMPSLRLSSHLSAGLEYHVNRRWFPTRDEMVDADVARLRVRAALNTRLSAEAFLQYEPSRERFAGDVRLRYRFAEGRDLYVVYNEARAPGGLPGMGDLPGDGRRRILVKYLHTFRF